MIDFFAVCENSHEEITNMKFSDLKVGDWFEYKGERFMRIEGIVMPNIVCVAVNLSNGERVFLSKDQLVFPARGTSFNIHNTEVESVLKPRWAEKK